MLTTVTVDVEMLTDVIVEAGDGEQVGAAPVTEIVMVLAGTVGQVLGYVVDVIVAPGVHEELVDLVCDVVVRVTRQEHAELTLEGEFLHCDEYGPSPVVAAV